jgi:cell division protein FtsI/penicillin-binding protein 2
MSGELHQRRLRRIRWLAAGLIGVGFVLAFALLYWQVWPGEKDITGNVGWASARVVDYRTRGSIFDLQGHYLALDTVAYELYAYPRSGEEEYTITECQTLAVDLAPILGATPDDLLELILMRNEMAVMISQFVHEETKQRIEELDCEGLYFDPYFIRLYPEDELFGPVVGLTLWLSVTGSSGIEAYYAPELTGREPTGWEGMSSPVETIGGEGLSGIGEGRGPSRDIARLPQVRDGADLYTTLDRNIQRIAYEAVADGVVRSRAERGLAIVMEPSTGKIRAVANYPSFDPNRYPDYWPDQAANYVDHSVGGTYEPGSVIKAMTVAAAMNEDLVSATTTFNDTGEITIGPKTIYNWDKLSYGMVNTVEVLAYSLNVEAAYIATVLEPARFYDYLRRFGFGESTGVDLAGEFPGELRVPGQSTWNISDLGTNSFGQGFSTTPMAVISAMSVLANGGKRMQPQVVERIDWNGVTSPVEPRVACEEVVTPSTAIEMSRMLAESVEMNVRQALVSGYRIAGKSGTSQVVVSGSYHPTRTIASFVGYGPIADPCCVILVKIDSPQEGEFGAEVAAPVFSRIAGAIFEYYGVPPSSVG